jgi:hypothetical protein
MYEAKYPIIKKKIERKKRAIVTIPHRTGAPL